MSEQMNTSVHPSVTTGYLWPGVLHHPNRQRKLHKTNLNAAVTAKRRSKPFIH